MKNYENHLRELELSQNTIKAYTEAVKDFAEKYKAITSENAIAYKQALLKKKSPATVNQKIAALNTYFSYLGTGIRLKSVKNPKPFSDERVISCQDLEKLLGILKAKRKTKQYWIVQYLARTGARVSELCQFRKADLDKGYCTLDSKGKHRKILIPSSLIEASREELSHTDSEWLFPNNSGNKMSTRGVQDLLSSMAKYGISKEVLHPHSFRHHFAISFLKADEDKDITLLSNLMGHSNINTTAVYLKLTEREQAEKLEKIMGVKC